MPTKAERTALMFLAAVVLAGSLVRLAGAVRRGARPSAVALDALSGQRLRADSFAALRAVGSARGSSRRAAKPLVTEGAPRPGEPRARERPQPERVSVDVDQATAAQLERLPRIGPALAARIVAERDARGPFRSLDSLEKRVRGIGPALARTIASHVTFSGR